MAFQCTLGSKFQAHWIATGLPLEDHWLRVRGTSQCMIDTNTRKYNENSSAYQSLHISADLFVLKSPACNICYINLPQRARSQCSCVIAVLPQTVFRMKRTYCRHTRPQSSPLCQNVTKCERLTIIYFSCIVAWCFCNSKNLISSRFIFLWHWYYDCILSTPVLVTVTGFQVMAVTIGLTWMVSFLWFKIPATHMRQEMEFGSYWIILILL